MWDAGPEYADLISGDHETITTASAWYAGTHLADLHVDHEGAERHDFVDGRDVRRTIEGLAVQDPDGALTPRRLSDPLAPFGQRVTVRQTISAARGRVAATYPYGEYLVTDPEPTSGWRAYRHTHIPTGGTVTLTLLDRWEVILRSRLTGLWQAAAGATVRTETRRLLRSVMPLVDATTPTTTIPASKRVHPEEQADASRALLDLAELVPHVDRSGRFAPLPTVGAEPVWALTIDQQADRGAIPRLTDEGIHNQVEVTGESDDADTEILAVASETGRLAPGPQFGWRVYQHHDPLYTTVRMARAGAQTRLRNLVSDRAITYTTRTGFDPCRDVLDRVALTVIPDNPHRPAVTMQGVVTGIRHPLSGGEMTVDVSVPWTEAGVYE